MMQTNEYLCPYNAVSLHFNNFAIFYLRLLVSACSGISLVSESWTAVMQSVIFIFWHLDWLIGREQISLLSCVLKAKGLLLEQ